MLINKWSVREAAAPAAVFFAHEKEFFRLCGIIPVFFIRFIRWASAARRVKTTAFSRRGFRRFLPGRIISFRSAWGRSIFHPFFSSDRHGYDTRNYGEIDCRLGTNADFAAVCDDLHAHGIRVVLDGVFQPCGARVLGFSGRAGKSGAVAYRDWFYIDFGRDNGYGDGLWYEAGRGILSSSS